MATARELGTSFHNRLFGIKDGTNSDTASSTTQTSDTTDSIGNAVIQQLMNAYNASVGSLGNDITSSPTGQQSYTDYLNTANQYNANADAATNDAINSLNMGDIDFQGQYNNSVADLARTIAASNARSGRTVGASMATRGLAGSGAYNQAINDVYSQGNANLASGVNQLASQLAQNTLTQRGQNVGLAQTKAGALQNKASQYYGQAVTVPQGANQARSLSSATIASGANVMNNIYNQQANRQAGQSATQSY